MEWHAYTEYLSAFVANLPFQAHAGPSFLDTSKQITGNISPSGFMLPNTVGLLAA